jgi:hypothetical protein
MSSAFRALPLRPLVDGRALRMLVLALATLAASSCRTAAPQPADRAPDTATLTVQNNQFNDRVIYVVVGGARQRLGTARGEGTTKMTIPRTWLTGPQPLRFLAVPIGGMGAERSQQITVYPGDDVQMVLDPT